MLGRIDRSIVPDMPDRIIAATSMALKVPVLTKDSRLKALTTIETIW
jgi:predicted nucleic acid-binding protein